jgi:Restriction endonuclease
MRCRPRLDPVGTPASPDTVVFVRIAAPPGDLLASIAELVGIKSGLALTQDELIRILEQESGGTERPGPWWREDPELIVSIRAEAIEADVTHVLFRVGTLPDPRTPFELLWDYTREGESVGDLLEPGSRLPPQLRAEYERRSLLNAGFPQQRDWDGAIPLADLFGSENVPDGATAGALFDQRYIDYLNAQDEDLDRIHWRQFELLTAEFFRRSGYEVELTPPRGDGGVDILAKRDTAPLGPELIVVQCKRYAADNTVTIEQVRAFWTVFDERGATRGLVATTSRLEAGARAWTSARQYRIGVADQEHVRDWLEQLATKRNVQA